MLDLLKSFVRGLTTNQVAKTPAAPVPLADTLRDAVAAAGLSRVGMRETSKNQGPGIGELWEATNYPQGDENREPWCAAFVCWCIMQAILWRGIVAPFKRPRTALAFGFEEWAKVNAVHGVQLLKPHAAVKRGDIIVYSFSHVEIAVADALAGSAQITCVGGNTSTEGSREGDGVYCKPRSRRSIRSIIRLPQ